MKKTAVILFNLGGPDSSGSIRPFLFNFFMDRNIIRIPIFLRFFIAVVISIRRSKKEAGDSYALLGGKSPLLENTQAQAQALEKELGSDFRVFVCMRYWHPMADEMARKVKNYKPDHIVLLPLYPQYSTTTKKSSFEAWERAAAKIKLFIPTTKICCYPLNKGFIKASAQNIKRAYESMLIETTTKNLPPPRVLFSAHGLPEDIIKEGDPYQWQCEQSVKAIVQEMDIEQLDWQICYQSRVGPKKWLDPDIRVALEKAGSEAVSVLVYPHSFVSEHVETLVEIDIEYRDLAKKLKIPYFARVETVGIMPDFIKSLAEIVRVHKEDKEMRSACGGRICPSNFCRCPSQIS